MSPSDLGEAPAPLQPTDSFRQAARVAMWPQVSRLLELEPALRNADATDDLKRYRVATRRLRAALRVFGEALPAKEVRAVEPELAALARAVGRVRDLDVRIGGLVAWAANGDADAGAAAAVEPMRAAWAAERATAAAEVEERLAGRRHAKLVDGLVALVGPAEDPTGKRSRRAVRDRAGSAVWAGFERLRAAAGDLDGADLDALHDLRIRAKRLRYTLEFLAPVLGADTTWLIARLVALQDHLGELHDADIAAGAATAFLDGDGAALEAGQRSAVEAYRAAKLATVEGLRVAAPQAAGATVTDGFALRLSRAALGPADPKRPTAPKGPRA